ncbi:hypothetical protein ETB97_010209 [Aspergillus alliaceus]|uniref:Uncharacterized protein n=1 Tax=Petromyces alliaceus TaxID=209559 RepID=A0A8H5ZTT3_PETAA|nr:hypothetical protein ETB97_010209 [Aspergillus burnettii]
MFEGGPQRAGSYPRLARGQELAALCPHFAGLPAALGGSGAKAARGNPREMMYLTYVALLCATTTFAFPLQGRDDVNPVSAVPKLPWYEPNFNLDDCWVSYSETCHGSRVYCNEKWYDKLDFVPKYETPQKCLDAREPADKTAAQEPTVTAENPMGTKRPILDGSDSQGPRLFDVQSGMNTLTGSTIAAFESLFSGSNRPGRSDSVQPYGNDNTGGSNTSSKSDPSVVSDGGEGDRMVSFVLCIRITAPRIPTPNPVPLCPQATRSTSCHGTHPAAHTLAATREAMRQNLSRNAMERRNIALSNTGARLIDSTTRTPRSV